MDKDLFVQKVKTLCLEKGIKPTNACKESKVGPSFLHDILRGQTPSVAKVQMLAEYLGVTTSELLGEKEKPATVSGSQPDFLVKFQSLPPADQDEIMAMVEYKLAKLTNGT